MVVRNVPALILLLAFVGQTFNQEFYYIGYLVEKKEYMKRCENKSRPEMHCKGKCQMVKKIKEHGLNENELPPVLKLAIKSVIVSPKISFTIPALSISDRAPTLLICTIGTPIDRPSTLFHPPDFA